MYVKNYFKTLAGIIWDSGAASMVDCQVFVVFGLTQPISKNHSSMMRPLKRTFKESRIKIRVQGSCVFLFAFQRIIKTSLFDEQKVVITIFYFEKMYIPFDPAGNSASPQCC